MPTVKPKADVEALAKLRAGIVELYRKTEMTQAQIAAMLHCRTSQVNTAIALLIPMRERAELVSKRRSLARLRNSLRVECCPHCGGILVHPQPDAVAGKQTYHPPADCTEQVQPQYVQLTLDL